MCVVDSVLQMLEGHSCAPHTTEKYTLSYMKVFRTFMRRCALVLRWSCNFHKLRRIQEKAQVRYKEREVSFTGAISQFQAARKMDVII